MTQLQLQRVTKRFGETTAVEELSLTVEPGEFLTIVGPSGSGKSTVLRLIAGLEEPTSGDILFDGHSILHLPPHARDVGMVFQNYALYPHLTVFENLAFPLRLRRWNRAAIANRVQEIAQLLGIAELLERYPRQLSGGQRQRVALGRALVRSPRLFLFDEPLSNVDAQLRSAMRAELVALQRTLGITALYVTHDQTEALSLGNRVAVLSGGRLLQVAPPAELYNRPISVTVARFIGSPPMNLLRTYVRGESLHFPDSEGHLPLPLTLPEDSEWFLGVRAEALTFRPQPGWYLFGRVRVEGVEYGGHEVVVAVSHSAVATPPLLVRLPVREPGPCIGEQLPLYLHQNAWCLFEPLSGRRVFPL
ncbi:MAG: ABC transporter ATP-binding protein [Chlorobiota bacterium]